MTMAAFFGSAPGLDGTLDNRLDIVIPLKPRLKLKYAERSLLGVLCDQGG
jgi:hypothetical protein